MPPAPEFGVNNALRFGNKKDVGVFFFRAYPCSQALALPSPKDKQHKPAHAKRLYELLLYIINIIYSIGWNIIHPRKRLCCITAVGKFKFARFDYTDSNVRKRLFPFGCPYKRSVQPQDSIKFLTRPATKGWLGRCKVTKKCLICKQYRRKIHGMP